VLSIDRIVLTPAEKASPDIRAPSVMAEIGNTMTDSGHPISQCNG
jgi:hypothetical protein